MGVRIIVVDDHPAVRLHLREWLARARDLEIVGEATPGSAAVALVGLVRPDVVLVDVHTSPEAGMGMIRLIDNWLPNVRVVAVGESDDHTRREAAEAGAWAYVPAMRNGEDLVQLVRSVAQRRQKGVLDLTDAAQRASP